MHRQISPPTTVMTQVGDRDGDVREGHTTNEQAKYVPNNVCKLFLIGDTILKRARPFKMTRFRLLNILLLLGFGIMKAVYSFMGNSIAPTTLELVFGSVLAAACVLSKQVHRRVLRQHTVYIENDLSRLYWFSLYEEVRPRVNIPIFHERLSAKAALRESALLYLSEWTPDIQLGRTTY